MQQRQFTTLLIDDRDENIVSLEAMLEEDNRIFLKANSGEQALKIAAENPGIGLIMLDVQMPGMDGFEVAGMLKSNERTKDIAIIFVTAINKEEQFILKGYSCGAVDYMQKPLNVSITRAKVKVFEQLYFYKQDIKYSVEQKDKVNEQLGRFMYVVAHDLKSPLSGISGLLHIMQQHKCAKEDEELGQYVNMAFSASTHLGNMISSILDYSLKNEGDLPQEEVDTHELVSNIARLLFPPPNIRITVEADMPKITTKKIKLQQVFQNLIGNAIKYNDKAQGEIVVGYEDDGIFYKFYVKDNGPGVSESDADRIFDLFYVSDNTTQHDSATGIGLNVVAVLIKEQGGNVTIDSTPGSGSCFYFQWCK